MAETGASARNGDVRTEVELLHTTLNDNVWKFDFNVTTAFGTFVLVVEAPVTTFGGLKDERGQQIGLNVDVARNYALQKCKTLCREMAKAFEQLKTPHQALTTW